MSITLCMEPQKPPLSWKYFRNNAQPRSIAIDGYVGAPPSFDAKKVLLNLNHHEGVSRLETRATCAQALMAVRQGLFDCFVDEDGNPDATVFANDCDEDVCLTWFILKNHQLTSPSINPLLNRLVYMEDLLDTTGGGYPFPPELPSLKELAWVFEPYQKFRVSGGLDKRDVNEFLDIINNVESRIMAYINEEGHTIELDTAYKARGGGEGWSMVKEIGVNARLGIFADGIKAFVCCRQRPDGRWVYTVGRQSIFVPFDVPGILQELDGIENLENEHWGGGNTIGGSPRVMGSKLSPEKVQKFINDFLASSQH